MNVAFNYRYALNYHDSVYYDCIDFSRKNKIGHIGEFDCFNFVIDAPWVGGRQLDNFLTRMFNKNCKKSKYSYDAYFVLLLDIVCLLTYCFDKETEKVLRKWQSRLWNDKETQEVCGITENDICDFYRIMD